MPDGIKASGRPRNRWSAAMWGGAALLLLLPWVAMRFTDEVDWTAMDFATFGTMLLLACGAYELAARSHGDRMYRAGAALAVAGGFFLVWVNLAVGIIGSERNPANLMFAGVLAVAIVGPAVARGRPRGMAYAMFATALAQATVGVLALVGGSGDALRLVALTGFFVAIWLGAAALFRMAAREPAR